VLTDHISAAIIVLDITSTSNQLSRLMRLHLTWKPPDLFGNRLSLL